MVNTMKKTILCAILTIITLPTHAEQLVKFKSAWECNDVLMHLMSSGYEYYHSNKTALTAGHAMELPYVNYPLSNGEKMVHLDCTLFYTMMIETADEFETRTDNFLNSTKISNDLHAKQLDQKLSKYGL
jgi:hypothetical protein